MLDVSRDEITEGSIVRALALLAAPIILQNLVQVAQQIVDIFWLGRLGETAVAAVGVNIPLTSLIFSVFTITTVGTQVLVSQRVGADELSRARRAVFHGMSLAFVFGIVITGLILVFGREIIAQFGAEPAVASAAVTYLLTYCLGFSILGMGDAIEMGFVGWGTRAPHSTSTSWLSASTSFSTRFSSSDWVFRVSTDTESPVPPSPRYSATVVRRSSPSA